MLIYYDGDYSEELTEKLRLRFNEEIEERDRVHLSDTCHCPVMAWCRLNGIDEDIDDRGIGIMLIGMVGQTLFQSLYPEEWTEFEPDASLPPEEQVPSHIDIYVQEPEKSFPVEIKWSRRNVTRGKDIGKSWLMQTTGYMARTNEREGKLVIFNIRNGKVHAFKFLLTDEELRIRNEEIDLIKKSIERADRENNPNLLEVWEKECRYCRYRPKRTRKKKGLGKGCPRYKGAIASQYPSSS